MSDSLNPFAPPAEVSTKPGQFAIEGVNYHLLAGTERGLRLVFYGILALVISFAFIMIAMIISPLLAVFGAVLALVGYLMILIGPFFCLSVPEESGGKGLIIASVIFTVFGVALSIGSTVLEFTEGGALTRIIDAVNSLVGIAASLLFLLFLGRIARYIRREDLQYRVTTLLASIGILVVLTVLILVAAIFVGETVLMFMAMIAVGGLLVFVMYASLVHSLYSAISVQRQSS